jgi:hypothetical protein
MSLGLAFAEIDVNPVNIRSAPKFAVTRSLEE